MGIVLQGGSTVEDNKNFELDDEILERVSGGLQSGEINDGRTETKVTAKVCCSKCGSNKGILYKWPDGYSFIACSNPYGKHTGDLFDLSAIIKPYPTEADYTKGW